jgi:uncharacterized membrane protein
MSGEAGKERDVNAVQTHPLIDDYLGRLHAAAWVLQPDRRNELVSEIREHIEDALRATGTRDEVAIRNVLERLGAPEEIVAAAVDGQPVDLPRAVPRSAAPIRRVGGLEIASIITLAIGGAILPVIGVAAGVVLAWASSVWTRADKLIATALPAVFMLLPALAVAARLGGFLPGLGRVAGPAPGFLLLPDLPELIWSGGLLFGPALGGLLAAIYLAIQASRRVRAPSPTPIRR